ncbi:thiamine-phosphate diphosphorylase [Winogradskyella epiphytica]|uniref:Thiamine-phosphate diphosphorylase n=1 Tax=Winogradskyella epiphytica TaxID=262005 RepID=A0A2V4XJ20_9FLAO|nr:thiamine phosphate synthase [Winogradskyella epiphytica]PYE81643.1 thiamine-phosphate diphosphorylase [Winogradskyella epiphytica]GGW63691.1 thiamine-phosphate synthase [Winogradskyella epiphytica]
MIIPKLHYISQGNSPKEHLDHIQKACTSGAELVQLNLSTVSEKKLLRIAKEAREITAHFQTRLLIKGNYNIAKTIKADGIHLDHTDVCPTLARTHLYTWQMIGGTAHTLGDCEDLIKKNIDYISLGPYKNIVSEDPALGLKDYAAILDVLAAHIPILGFGGITLEEVKDILHTGISGLAVSDAITCDFNSIKTFNQLLNASATAEQRHSFK